MDPDDFAAVVAELLEHVSARVKEPSAVRVIVDDDWCIRIVADGVAISQQDPQMVSSGSVCGVDPSEARSGLPVAASILKRYGGTLRLLSPATGQTDGVEAIVELP